MEPVRHEHTHVIKRTSQLNFFKNFGLMWLMRFIALCEFLHTVFTSNPQSDLLTTCVSVLLLLKKNLKPKGWLKMISIIYEETFFSQLTGRQTTFLTTIFSVYSVNRYCSWMCIPPPPKKGISDFVAYFYRLIIHNKQLHCNQELEPFHSVVEEGIS